MKILEHEAVKTLPVLLTQENIDNPIITVRIYHPLSDWYWYPYEFDSKQGLFFGYVRGFEGELGYFSIEELDEIEGTSGEAFLVDETFTAMPLSEVKKLPNRQMPNDSIIIIYIL